MLLKRSDDVQVSKPNNWSLPKNKTRDHAEVTAFQQPVSFAGIRQVVQTPLQ